MSKRRMISYVKGWVLESVYLEANAITHKKPESGKQRSLPEKTLQEIIRRIVDVAQPEKIILFGSAARGKMGPNSDVDLLVIKSGVHRRKLAMEIYKNLSGVGCAVDVIVVTPEDIERYAHCPALIIEPALREGRVVYAE